MSAHRDPDMVADYAKNAHMRGLRVIIAGAGLSAALPGVVAAHTDLPVIGVPLIEPPESAAGGLDALLSIAQMPPGVPVACVGLDNARNARRDPARRADPAAVSAASVVIAALHPPRSSGPLWTDEARMEALAPTSRSRPCEELGRARRAEPTSRRSAARPSPSRRSRSASAVTDHDVAAFVDVLAASAGPGRALDPLRADLLRRARHRAGAAAPGGRARSSWRARASCARRWPRGRASTPTRCASGAPTASTPSRPPSGSSSPASRSRPTATPSAWSARSRRPRSARSRGAVGTYSATSPEFEAARARAAGPRRASRSPPRSSRATATPSCCRRSRWPGAGLERFATEIRHLQRTEVREVEEPFRAGPEGLERDAAQAQPDHHRAHHRPRARAARQRAGRRSRTSRCGTSATSRTPAPSA